MTATTARPKGAEDLMLALLLAGAVLAGVTWLGGAGYLVLSGQSVPHGRLFAGLAALAHPLDPGRAWGSTGIAPALYWAASGLVFLVAAGAGWGALLLWRAHGPGATSDDPHRLPGLASRRQVTAAAGPKALLGKAPVLRPSLAKPRAVDVGFRLGRSRGVECWGCVRDSTVILGPPGAGKGLHLVVPMVLDAPGPLVTTSTRPDNLAVALAARARRGPVAVFDPQGLAPGVPSAARWSPVRGCERPRTAMGRAVALVGDAARGTENASFWAQQTVQAVRCLLHAAALGGKTALDLYRWSLSPAGAKDAVEVLGDDPRAATSWAGRSTPSSRPSGAPVTRSGRWWPTPSPPWPTPPSWPPCRRGRRTALTQRSSCAAKGRSSCSARPRGRRPPLGSLPPWSKTWSKRPATWPPPRPAARLDPPLALVLDEAANYPLPSLSSLMSEGGGTGISTTVVLQSLAQARDRWGREAAQAIWDAATVKVVLGGQANADDLADLSRLLGEVEVKEVTESWARGGERTVTVANRHKPVLEPSALRTLPFGAAVLLLRSAPPVVLDLEPWTARSDAKVLQAERESLEVRSAPRRRRKGPRCVSRGRGRPGRSTAWPTGPSTCPGRARPGARRGASGGSTSGTNATAASRAASCAGAPGARRRDLHHVSYVRLGAEAFSDLWPACRRCHEALHLVWDASPAWRAMGREAASAGIALALRRLLVLREARGDG